MIAPTAEALTETLTHACSIADQLAGDWAVILYDSTYPGGRNPDRPTRVHPRPSPDAPDLVPGDRDDTGVGVHKGKQACATAAGHVVTAHRLAGVAACWLAGMSPPVLTSRPARDAQAFRGQVMKTVGRIRYLMGHGITRADDGTRAQAHAAAVALLEAHAAVKGLMRDHEGVGELTAERRCWNCQRPATYPKTMECEACSKYRRRVEAQIRAGRTPQHRYRPVPRFEEAHRALQRRTERLRPGQLDIEGPLPSGSYLAGEFVQAKPRPEDGQRKEAS